VGTVPGDGSELQGGAVIDGSMHAYGDRLLQLRNKEPSHTWLRVLTELEMLWYAERIVFTFLATVGESA